MTEDQIKHMVDRFLMWKLPEQFNTDNGISFDPIASKGAAHEFKRQPQGTNLFDATQADAMVRHMIDGLPASGSSTYFIEIEGLIEVTSAITVETVGQLRLAAFELCDAGDDYLDTTYVVSRIAETLSDGSVSVSLSIRRAIEESAR